MCRALYFTHLNADEDFKQQRQQIQTEVIQNSRLLRLYWEWEALYIISLLICFDLMNVCLLFPHFFPFVRLHSLQKFVARIQVDFQQKKISARIGRYFCVTLQSLHCLSMGNSIFSIKGYFNDHSYKLQYYHPIKMCHTNPTFLVANYMTKKQQRKKW